MKKTILLLAIAMASLMAHAQSIAILEAYQLGNYNIVYPQNNHICQPDTILLHTNHSIIEGDSVLLFNAYDNCGLFTQCRIHYHDDFDKDGNPMPNIPPIQFKTDYEYDLRHNVIKETGQTYSGPRPGRDLYRYYYQDDKLALYIRQYIDFLGDTLYTRDSIIYKYDSQGRIQEEVAYNMSQYSKITNYLYNANEIVITTEGLEFNHFGNWIHLNNETRTYNEDGILLGIVSETYDNPPCYETYSYDNGGRVASVLRKVWDSTEWVNRRLLEYNYDLSGHLTLAEIKIWQDGLFVNAHRAIYELNSAGYPIVVTFEKWNGEEWEQGTWQPGFYIFSDDYLKRQNDFICRKDAKRIEIHYTNTPMPDYEVEEHENEEVPCTFYPNPTTGLVTITGKDLESAEVVNTLGQRVATATGKGKTLQINIANLPAGVYFVNITDEEGRKCVKKVVKE